MLKHVGGDGGGHCREERKVVSAQQKWRMLTSQTRRRTRDEKGRRVLNFVDTSLPPLLFLTLISCATSGGVVSCSLTLGSVGRRRWKHRRSKRILLLYFDAVLWKVSITNRKLLNNSFCSDINFICYLLQTNSRELFSSRDHPISHRLSNGRTSCNPFAVEYSAVSSPIT